MHPVPTERRRLIVQLERMLELPMFLLSFVWLILAVVEITRGLSPGAQLAGTVIWIVFIIEFGVRFAIAPEKIPFVRSNWVTGLSLVLPALRIFRAVRFLRVARVARGMRVARLLSSMNRGMLALRRRLRKQGAGYVLTASLIVLFAGAAGMMAFESEGANHNAFASYESALWWTAMLMTTVGSEYWPRTGAGKALTLAISLYSLGVFGYITATLASFFVGEKRRP
ncbi:MAG TPA: ion transporter [Thermoanaerobaculia bacterium]|nr:ion transporter [Thermoanaerobaculia bacterium]